LVPRYRRGEWLEEWTGELKALGVYRSQGHARNYPGIGRFVLGALPHALWTRKEEHSLESLGKDIRYALRVLRRSPGFSVVAVLTLALGIGVNGAIFSLGNGLLFRPPPGLADPGRLVQIARSYDNAPRWDSWSWPAVRLIRDEARLLSGVAGYSSSTFVLGRGEGTIPAQGQFVSAEYFDLLGIRPVLGRMLGPQDEVAPGAHPVVVLSYGLWMRRFGGDPGVIGSSLPVGGAPYELVGVAPEGFVGVETTGSPPDLWVPIMQRVSSSGQLPFEEWGSSWIYLFGRLREGVDYRTAEASMDALTLRLRESSEINEGIRIEMAPGIGLSPDERAEAIRLTFLLMGIGLMVLLLTCFNVGNLFMARASTRGMEMGVRRALGAGRGRLTRQLFTETLLLSVLATAVALPLVAGTAGALPSLFPVALAVPLEPDLKVFLFLAVIGLLAGVLFGTAPAWALARTSLAHVLREGGTTGGRKRTLLRDGLVVGQLAISLGLLSGAALLGRSVMNARRANPGFDPDGLLIGFINLYATGRYDEAGMVDFQERLLREARDLPGVGAVTLAGQAPVLGGHSRSTVRPADGPDDPGAGFEAEFTVVTPGYFETLGIQLLRGRTFRPPSEEPEGVVVVNDALARRFWPGEEAVGKELQRGDRVLKIIGVVADVQMRSLRAPPRPAAYYPYHQEPEGYLAIHVRSPAPPAVAIEGIRRAVAAVDPEVPVTGITDLRQGLARSLSETRIFGTVVGTFAGLALTLSLLGLYGLVSFGVTHRSRELGIRMALGAEKGELVGLVLLRGLGLSAGGLALGILVAVGVGHGLEGILFGVPGTSAPILGASAVLFLLAGLVSAWIPARRAGRVDAVVSLRSR